MQLSLDQIRLDGGTQPRAEVLVSVVEEYAEQMREGAMFPPVVVFHDGSDYWLADGFHRVAAALRARPAEPIDVEVLQGTQSDAQWYSYGVNKSHGLRRTNEDKERAVNAALRHPGGASKSDREIADHVGVHYVTVSRHRAKLQSSGAMHQMRSRTVTRGQSTFVQNTTGISEANRRRVHPGLAERPPRTTLKVHQPVRLPVPVEKMTSVTLPHNPVMGARTLIEVFDVPYLRAVVAELVTYLNSVSESA
jgi:hypothetical protein